jgi:hypothetical protein
MNSPRIYVYKITFDEVPYYYYGIHKEKTFDEYYMGSPKTHDVFWQVCTPNKEIIRTFDYTDTGWIEAQEFEKSLIRPVFNTDPHCLNENCGGKISLEKSRRTGRRNYENGIGLFSRSKEQMIKDGSKAGKTCYEKGVGIHGLTEEERTKHRSLAGMRTRECNVGIFGRSKEEKIEHGQKGYSQSLANLSKEKRLENSSKGGKLGAKVQHSQKWQCTITGYISTPAPLSRYQKSRGIDTSNRVKVEGEITWKITFDCGKVVIIDTLSTWAKENGYSPACLYQVKIGRLKNHKGIIKVVSS